MTQTKAEMIAEMKRYGIRGINGLGKIPEIKKKLLDAMAEYIDHNTVVFWQGSKDGGVGLDRDSGIEEILVEFDEITKGTLSEILRRTKEVHGAI